MLASWNLRRTNNFLLAAIIILNLYVIVAPLAPAVIFWFESRGSHENYLSQILRSPSSSNGSSATKNSTYSSVNSLVVPSMLLKAPINEAPISQTYQILDKGVWRWPLGSTPAAGGNTILIGHRFTYTNPRGIFYELDKLKLHGQLAVFWNKKEYVYQVSKVEVVPPSDTAVLNQTKQPELTLYTCTPTWDPTQRLVVVAKLIAPKAEKS